MRSLLLRTYEWYNDRPFRLRARIRTILRRLDAEYNYREYEPLSYTEYLTSMSTSLVLARERDRLVAKLVDERADESLAR